MQFKQQYLRNSTAQNRAAATDIYDTFIAVNAPLAINVSFDVLEPLRSTGAGVGAVDTGMVTLDPSNEAGAAELRGSPVSEEMYTEAAAETVHLMVTDTLRRFMKSPKYRQIWDDFVESRTHLEERVMVNQKAHLR